MNHKKDKILKLKMPKGYVPVEYDLEVKGKEMVLIVKCVDGTFRTMIKNLLMKYHFNK